MLLQHARVLDQAKQLVLQNAKAAEKPWPPLAAAALALNSSGGDATLEQLIPPDSTRRFSTSGEPAAPFPMSLTSCKPGVHVTQLPHTSEVVVCCKCSPGGGARLGCASGTADAALNHCSQQRLGMRVKAGHRCTCTDGHDLQAPNSKPPHTSTVHENGRSADTGNTACVAWHCGLAESATVGQLML